MVGTYSSVTEYELPKSIDLGAKANYFVEGHLDTELPTGWGNFAVGLFYMDGPADEVGITIDTQLFRVPKGMGVIKYLEVAEACTSLTMLGDISVDRAGTYRFAAVTGYYDVERGGFSSTKGSIRCERLLHLHSLGT